MSGLRRSSLLGRWVWLEINMTMFILVSYYEKSHRIIVKYFFSQAIFSTILLALILAWYTGVFTMHGLLILMYLALIGKLGIPPFCFWFLEILQCAYNDVLFFSLLTIQKILPLYIVSITSQILPFRFLLVSLVFVVVSRTSHLTLSWVISLSAIFNTLWILIIINNFNIVIWYLIIYSVHIAVLLLCLINSSKIVAHYPIFSELRLSSSLYLFVLFLRIGGFPPFLGFCGKFPAIMVILEELTERTLTIIILVRVSVLVIYIYINFSYKVTIQNKATTFSNYKSGKGLAESRILAILFLPLVFLLI